MTVKGQNLEKNWNLENDPYQYERVFYGEEIEVRFPETQLSNALCNLVHYSPQARFPKGTKMFLSNLLKHPQHPARLIPPVQRNVVLLLIFSPISCGGRKLSRRETSLPGLLSGDVEVERSPPPRGDGPASVCWCDLRGLEALCVSARAWAAFVFPIKCLKQWTMARGQSWLRYNPGNKRASPRSYSKDARRLLFMIFSSITGPAHSNGRTSDASETVSGPQKPRNAVRQRDEIKGKYGVKLRYRKQEKAARAVRV